MLSGSCTGFTHGAKSVCIIYHQSELVTIFEGYNVFDIALISAHAENPFGNHQDGPTGSFSQFGGALELFFEIRDVIVSIYKAFSLVQTHAIDNTSVALRIVNDDVSSVY